MVFANGHRTMYKEHIQTLDLHFRKFCRSIVRPPPTCYPTTFAHHYGVKPRESLQLWWSWSGRLGLIRDDHCFSGFHSKAMGSNCLTNAPKRLPASTRDCAKIKMSSAKRQSSKLGPPSIKLKPIFPTSALHSHRPL